MTAVFPTVGVSPLALDKQSAPTGFPAGALLLHSTKAVSILLSVLGKRHLPDTERLSIQHSGALLLSVGSFLVWELHSH